MIEAGCKDDIPEILPLAAEFWSVTGYDEPFCEDSATGMLELSVDQGLLSVLRIDGEVAGFASGVASGLLCNLSIPAGAETAWWVSPKHRGGGGGIGLLKHLESLAKEAGIKYWSMAFLENSMPESIGRIYNRMGYKLTLIGSRAPVSTSRESN